MARKDLKILTTLGVEPRTAGVPHSAAAYDALGNEIADKYISKVEISKVIGENDTDSISVMTKTAKGTVTSSSVSVPKKTIVDQTLDIESENAVANAPVTTKLNSLQQTLDTKASDAAVKNLQGQVQLLGTQKQDKISNSDLLESITYDKNSNTIAVDGITVAGGQEAGTNVVANPDDVSADTEKLTSVKISGKSYRLGTTDGMTINSVNNPTTEGAPTLNYIEISGKNYQLPKGGGGSGGSGSSDRVTVTAITPYAPAVQSFAIGTEVGIDFNWESESEGVGIIHTFVQGSEVDQFTAAQGDVHVDLTPYLTSAMSYNIKITVEDIDGNKRNVAYIVSGIAIGISSTFDETIARPSEGFNFIFTSTGNVEKTVHVLLDGNLIEDVIVKTSGKVSSVMIPQLTHGAHELKAYATADVNGTAIESNILDYSFIAYEVGNTTPIISSNFKSGTELIDGAAVNISFVVYSPKEDGSTEVSTDVRLSSFDSSGKQLSEKIITVDRTQQHWLSRDYKLNSGEDSSENTFKIEVVKVTRKTIPYTLEELHQRGYVGNGSRTLQADNTLTDLVLNADGTINTSDDPNFTGATSYTVIDSVDEVLASKEFTVIIKKSDVDVEASTAELKLHLPAFGRTNSEPETERNQWVYDDGINKYTTDFTSGWNWISNGWVLDESGNSSLLAAGSATGQINFLPFEKDAKETGKTIEIEFKTHGVLEDDVPVIWCASGSNGNADDEDWRGFKVFGTEVKFQSAGTSLSARFKEDERVRISFVIESTNQNKFVYIYINAIMSGVVIYQTTDSFNQLIPDTIHFGSEACDVNIYNIRVYDVGMDYKQILNNYIADQEDPAVKSEIFARNQIYDSTNETVVYEQVKKLLPVFTLTIDSLPQSKEDVRELGTGIGQTSYIGHMKFENLFNPSTNFEGDIKKMKTQGQSSLQYPQKNYKIWIVPQISDSGKEEKNPIKLYDNAKGEKKFTLKVDYASSNGAYNAMNSRMVNDMYEKDSWNPNRKESLVNFNKPVEDKDHKDWIARDAVYGIPCAIFWQPDIGTTPIFYCKGSLNTDKSARALNYKTEYTDTTESAIDDKPVYDNQNGTRTLTTELDTDESWSLENNTSALCNFNPVMTGGTNENPVYDWSSLDKDFEARFPDEYDPDTLDLYPNEKVHMYDKLKELISFVASFKKDKSIHDLYITWGEFVEKAHKANEESVKAHAEDPTVDIVWTEEDIKKEAARHYSLSASSTKSSHYGVADDELVINRFNLDIAGFKKKCKYMFNEYYLEMYYVITMAIGGIDSFTKNFYPTYFQNSEDIHHLDKKHNKEAYDGRWYPQFYDMDTAYGNDNTGRLVFNYDIELHDQRVGATASEDVDQDGVKSSFDFNGNGNLLWVLVEYAYENELAKLYTHLRSSGILTYDKIIENVYTNGISKFCEAIYNEDQKVKYIDVYLGINHYPGTGTQISAGTNYLSTVLGSTTEHLKWWIKNRLDYLDSMWGAAAFSDATNTITFRSNTPSKPDNPNWKPSTSLRLTTSADTYMKVRFATKYTWTQRIKEGEATTIDVPLPEGFKLNDTESYIYGPSKISKINDMSNFYVNLIDVSKATSLTYLNIGSQEAGYENNGLTALSLTSNTLLKHLDITNCKKLGTKEGILDLSNNPKMEELYAKGTKYKSVTFTSGGELKILELPDTITSLKLIGQSHIERLDCDGKLESIRIEKSNVNSLDLVKKAIKDETLKRLTLKNIEWTISNANNEATDLLDYLIANIKGIDDNDNTINGVPVITGTIRINGSVYDDLLEKYRNAFNSKDLTITASSITPRYKVHYYNYDGSQLLTGTKYPDSAIMVEQGHIPSYPGKRPTKPYNTELLKAYSFTGWKMVTYDEYKKNGINSTEFKAVPALGEAIYEDKAYVAVFDEKDAVTVDFVDDDETNYLCDQEYVAINSNESVSYPVSMPVPNKKVHDSSDNSSNKYCFAYWQEAVKDVSTNRFVPKEGGQVFELNDSVIVNNKTTFIAVYYDVGPLEIHYSVWQNVYGKSSASAAGVFHSGIGNVPNIQIGNFYGNYDIYWDYDNDKEDTQSGVSAGSLSVNRPEQYQIEKDDKGKTTQRRYHVVLRFAISDSNDNDYPTIGGFSQSSSDDFFNNHITYMAIGSSVALQSASLANLHALKRVTLLSGKALSAIPSRCFANDGMLNAVDVGDAITNIDSIAFTSTSITSLKLPMSVSAIDPRAFDDSSIETIEFPQKTNKSDVYDTATDNTVYGFNDGQLYKISNGKPSTLVRVLMTSNNYKIADTITEIGDYCFQNHYENTFNEVKIPKSVQTIGAYAFAYSSGLTTIDLSEATSLKELKSSFMSSTSVKELYIPKSVSTIALPLNMGVNSFAKITVSDENSSFSADNQGILYNYSKTTLVCCPNNISITKEDGSEAAIEIPKSVTSLSEYSFYSCNNSQKLDIPASVNAIGAYSFANSKFKSIDLSKTTVNSLADNLFNSALISEFVIPSTVAKIGSGVFYGCNYLNSVTFTPIDDKAETKEYLVTSIGSNSFAQCPKITELEIPDSVTTIGSYIFSNDTLLEKLHVSDNITQIPDGFAQNCPVLDEFNIPENITYIGNNAFQGCVAIDRFDIPKTVRSIGAYSFYRCTGMPIMVIPQSVNNIGSKALWIGKDTDKVTIIFYEDVPPVIVSDTFDKDHISSIRVPGMSYEAYVNSTNFNSYSSIIAGDGSYWYESPSDAVVTYADESSRTVHHKLHYTVGNNNDETVQSSYEDAIKVTSGDENLVKIENVVVTAPTNLLSVPSEAGDYKKGIDVGILEYDEVANTENTAPANTSVTISMSVLDKDSKTNTYSRDYDVWAIDSISTSHIIKTEDLPIPDANTDMSDSSVLHGFKPRYTDNTNTIIKYYESDNAGDQGPKDEFGSYTGSFALTRFYFYITEKDQLTVWCFNSSANPDGGMVSAIDKGLSATVSVDVSQQYDDSKIDNIYAGTVNIAPRSFTNYAGNGVKPIHYPKLGAAGVHWFEAKYYKDTYDDPTIVSTVNDTMRLMPTFMADSTAKDMPENLDEKKETKKTSEAA